MSDESTMESKGLNWRKVVLALIVLSILIWIGYQFDWITGFSGKQLWDWMTILNTPAVLAIVAYWLDESVRQREIKRNEGIALNEFRKNLLANLTRAYFKAKKARRILDGNIENKKDNTCTGEISRKVYEAQIKEIIDAQLEFEFYHDQLEANPHIFSDKSTHDLEDLTHQIEHNLNAIIKEYQDLNPSIDPLKYDTLKELKDFIATETFKTKFSNHFHKCFDLIQREFLPL